MYDVIVIGAGIAGMATACRLQAQGLSTLIVEAHGQPGGCAGFFRQRGFAFDVGATTLVDFETSGVGGEFLNSIGMSPLDGEVLPGYVAWLPDRNVTLHRDHTLWAAERLTQLGDTPQHRSFWKFLDQIANVFWQATTRGIKLPMRQTADLLRNIQAVGLSNLPLARFLNWTMGDALRTFKLRDDAPLVGLLSMLIEDTVHSTVDEAPLINAALGITIRGAGLMRHRGGMYGFWQRLVAHYRALGGTLKVGCQARGIEAQSGSFAVHTQRGMFRSEQVVSAIPAVLTARLAPPVVSQTLRPYLERDSESLGSAIVIFLGVPEREIEGQEFTHHQLLQDYGQPLGNGNNMFISVSAPGDTESAPAGYRAVMISTHCDLDPWKSLPDPLYRAQKQAIGDCLVEFARRVYPHLGENALVFEIGTPRTYERYTGRPDGAVGGIRQTLHNANQQAIPYHSGIDGLWLVGDTTWPGLGTVACVLGSRLVAEEVIQYQSRKDGK
jgi:C-3',4' desaturase CrtD